MNSAKNFPVGTEAIGKDDNLYYVVEDKLKRKRWKLKKEKKIIEYEEDSKEYKINKLLLEIENMYENVNIYKDNEEKFKNLIKNLREEIKILK